MATGRSPSAAEAKDGRERPTGRSPSATEAKDGRERPLTRRGRRWLIAVSILASVLALAGWWIDRQLEPRRLTALVLEKAGASLGLKLTFASEPDYAFKPEPRLLIPNLVVRNTTNGKVFLSAARAEISLPWDTITGGAPVITRIELDAAILDLPGLREWQATRPPAPFELPTLSKGLRINDGRVRDDGFVVSKLDLDLPRLKSSEPATMQASGVLDLDGTVIAFDLALAAATPGLESDFTLDGSGELQQKPQALPFKLKSAGRYRSDDAAFSIEARSLDFVGTTPLPNLEGKFSLRLVDNMALKFEGRLKEWAKDWPALPAPLDASAKPMPLLVEYLGANDFSDPLKIDLAPDNARLQSSLRIADMQQWLDTADGSPLPPLDATLSTPMLEIEGIRLEGVEIEIRDSSEQDAKPGDPKPAAAPAKIEP